ncbi:uncharacterized protein LOC142229216 [Haematobia irritans]|uniref:uncharacterized protein LOC142229216 n=1 Tax=Haematobia irritans TaxID=7368 RepID=UPI003F4F4106
MPSCGGPVYQPTTVSYEPRSNSGNGSGGGLGFLGPASSIDSPLRIFRKPKPQVALLLFALISLAAGIAMLASGWLDWIEDQEYERQLKEQTPTTSSGEQEEVTSETQTEAVSCVEIPLGIILGGVFMTCLGIAALGVYLKVADWRRSCVCPCPFFDKKQSLARQLQCQNVEGGCGGQGIMALNPSTDPLVSHTQYAPVSELPSLRAEDEERRNLMPDNKDCLSSAEESDRMLEPDPRIVLRPMGRVEDA